MRYTNCAMLPERAFQKKLSIYSAPATLEGGGGSILNSVVQFGADVVATVSGNPELIPLINAGLSVAEGGCASSALEGAAIGSLTGGIFCGEACAVGGLSGSGACVNQAISDVQNGSMTIEQAAQETGIPLQETFSDGTISTYDPNGNVVNDYSNGTSQTLNSQGQLVQNVDNGVTTTYDPSNGSIESNTFQNPDGSVVDVSPGATVNTNASGELVSSTSGPSDAQVTTNYNSDGTVENTTQTLPSGETQTTLPDGSQTITNSEGQTVRTVSADGKVDLFPEGNATPGVNSEPGLAQQAIDNNQAARGALPETSAAAPNASNTGVALPAAPSGLQAALNAAATGAGKGGIIGAINAALHGGCVVKGALSGAATGGVGAGAGSVAGGALSSLFCGSKLAQTIGSGIGGGLAGGATSAAINHKNIGTGALIGGLTGATSSGIGAAVNSLLPCDPTAAKIISTIGGAAAKAAATGQNVGQAVTSGLENLGTGAVTGAAVNAAGNGNTPTDTASNPPSVSDIVNGNLPANSPWSGTSCATGKVTVTGAPVDSNQTALPTPANAFPDPASPTGYSDAQGDPVADPNAQTPTDTAAVNPTDATQAALGATTGSSSANYTTPGATVTPTPSGSNTNGYTTPGVTDSGGSGDQTASGTGTGTDTPTPTPTDTPTTTVTPTPTPTSTSSGGLSAAQIAALVASAAAGTSASANANKAISQTATPKASVVHGTQIALPMSSYNLSTDALQQPTYNPMSESEIQNAKKGGLISLATGGSSTCCAANATPSLVKGTAVKLPLSSISLSDSQYAAPAYNPSSEQAIQSAATGGQIGTSQVPQASLVHGSPVNFHQGFHGLNPLAGAPHMADGGGVPGHHPEFYSEGGLHHFVQGGGTGTSDSVPAMLANGEFVLPADIVSSLGDGSNQSGAKILDEFLKVVRAHKQSHDAKHLPPDSKGPLGYLLEARKKVK